MSQCYEMCSCTSFVVGTVYVARYNMEIIFKFRLCSAEYYQRSRGLCKNLSLFQPKIHQVSGTQINTGNVNSFQVFNNRFSILHVQVMVNCDLICIFLQCTKWCRFPRNEISSTLPYLQQAQVLQKTKLAHTTALLFALHLCNLL